MTQAITDTLRKAVRTKIEERKQGFLNSDSSVEEGTKKFGNPGVIRKLNEEVETKFVVMERHIVSLTQKVQDGVLTPSDISDNVKESVLKLAQLIELAPENTETGDDINTLNFVPPSKADISDYWGDRPRSNSETPPEWIARVFKPWVGRGLNRAHVASIDPKLGMALKNWLRRREMPEWLDLPKAYESHGDYTPSPADLAVWKKVQSFKGKEYHRKKAA